MNTKEEIERIVRWIQTYAYDHGICGLVYGLSGGIDSALAATLAVQALGKENVFGVILPCHSNPKDQEDAILLAKWLGIEYRVVDLTATYDTQVKACEGRQLYGNTKSRLRMIELYATAEDFNVQIRDRNVIPQVWIVGGTTNQSEWMTGYFTKFGDGANDVEPILEYYKDEVYEMARSITGFPQVILDRIPTAGYTSDQTDEGEMGITYPRLDAVLRVMKLGCPEKLSGLPSEDVDTVKRLIKASEHKRRPTPYCPR